MKLRPLLPSLREKKRYLAFEVFSEGKPSFEQAKIGIEHSIQNFLGELGAARAGVLFLQDWKQNRGILKVNTSYVNEVKASLALVQELQEQKTIIRSIGVSGTLAKLRGLYF